MPFPSLSSHPAEDWNNAGSGAPFGTVPSRNVQLHFVHADENKRARFVRVVGELQLVSFDQVLMVPQVMRQLGVALQKFRRGVDEGAPDVVLPVPRSAQIAPDAGFSTGGTCLATRDALLLDRVVVDHGHGIALVATIGGVHTRRQGVAEFRFPGGFGYFGLTRKQYPEAILHVLVLGPFLRRRRHGREQQYGEEQRQCTPHDRSS